MPFQPGNHVRLIHNPGRTGVVSPAGCREQSGVLRVQVQFGDSALSWMRATSVEKVPGTNDPRGDFLRGRVAGPDSLRRILMHEKMGGRLSGVLYSMETSDTMFLPYQFKPVLKLIESPCNSLLIADEVGLGKTIEAGLIWTELRARTGAQRLLVVCPAKLKLKWMRELSRRFGVRATEAGAKDVLDHLQEFRRNRSHSFALVASYQALRPPSGWEDASPQADHRTALAHLLSDATQGEPPLDLVVMDEAHYMRNSETKTFDLGELLTEAAVHRVFLSATPLHTSNLNLYSLLRLLDPDTFNNEQAFHGIIEANIPLVRLRDTLVNPSSSAEDALVHIKDALLNPYVSESQMLGNLRTALQEPGALSSPSRRAAYAYQAERINLLGHAFSRTRKRDVTKPEDRVHRNVVARKVVMTPAEAKVYQEVSELALDFAAENDLPSGFLAVTPQRMVSSSIVAALDHWIGPVGGRLTDSDDSALEHRPFVQFLHERLHGRFDLAALRKTDTKFHLLLAELRLYWRDHPGGKIVIFSTFRPTVGYLAEMLAEQNIKSMVLKGGGAIAPDEIIDEFASSQGPDLLISTEVGGEGLDMQFAGTIINYDLPWNPMVVEQRIGRIDRIGQKERQILILNLLQEGTIDERIYDRLYARLDLFRNSIGDLEAVVGPVLDKMQRALVTHRLTEDRQNEIIRQAEVAIASEQKAKERLEESASLFVAYGDYLLEQIRSKHEQEQWVNAEEIEYYVQDFVTNQLPQTRLTGIDAQEKTYEIQLDVETYAEFEQFLGVHNLRGQTQICSATPRRIRFDHRLYAKGATGIEQVSQAHPLVRFIAELTRQRRLTPCVPVALTLIRADAKSKLKPGVYLFNVQRWEVSGLRQIERLRHDARMVAATEPLDEAQAERLIDSAARNGERWPAWTDAVEHQGIINNLDRLDDDASDAFIEYEATCMGENEDRARVQLTSIDRFEQRRTGKHLELIERYALQGPRNLKAAEEGKLAKLKERCVVQRRKIKEKSHVAAEYSRICFGLINLV